MNVTAYADKQPWLRRVTVRRTLRKIILYILLSVVAALFSIPLVWMLSTSLKSLPQQDAWPPV